MLEVDLERLFDCLHAADADGADILYAGVLWMTRPTAGWCSTSPSTVRTPPNSRSDYGVRIRNAALAGLDDLRRTDTARIDHGHRSGRLPLR